MDRIKSAYEMAMERFKQRKEVSRDDVVKMEYMPLGMAIAANFLREKDYNLIFEIDKYQAALRTYVTEGSQETFLNNILMPLEKTVLETNKKAMEGLMLIKDDKQATGEAFSQLEHLFNYYSRTLEQALGKLKESFAARASSATGKRGGARAKTDPEKMPGFYEEWIRATAGLNSQYEQSLNELKEKLREIK